MVICKNMPIQSKYEEVSIASMFTNCSDFSSCTKKSVESRRKFVKVCTRFMQIMFGKLDPTRCRSKGTFHDRYTRPLGSRGVFFHESVTRRPDGTMLAKPFASLYKLMTKANYDKCHLCEISPSATARCRATCKIVSTELDFKNQISQLSFNCF